MSNLKSSILAQIEAAGPGHVWVPVDFAQLGNRNVINKTLQRMVLAGDLCRIDRPKLHSDPGTIFPVPTNPEQG